MADIEETAELKSRCCSACDLSKSKLAVVLFVVWIIATAYVVASALDETRWIIKQLLPDSTAVVCLLVAGSISSAMAFYMILYVPLWITTAMYHFNNVIVPLLYWIVLRIAGWVIFIAVSVYIFARFILGIPNPVQYMYDIYAFVDLVPSMINARLEPYGGAWGYLQQWYA